MGALHADALGQLPDLALAELQLLLQVGPLELLARLAQRQRHQVLAEQPFVRRQLLAERLLDFLEADLLFAAHDQQAMDEVA